MATCLANGVLLINIVYKTRWRNTEYCLIHLLRRLGTARYYKVLRTLLLTNADGATSPMVHCASPPLFKFLIYPLTISHM